MNPQSAIRNPQSSGNDPRWLWGGYAFILLFLAVRLAYQAIGHIELSEDEAYQWLWSKHPALSYYSKPPMIVYTQWVGTHLWGDNEFGVRFFSPVIAALVMFLMLRLLAREAGARAGFWLVVILSVTPIMAVGATLMTIDPLSVLFWTASFICGWRAIQKDCICSWCWAGLWLGFGFFSKYTALFQLLSWAVFFVLWPPARQQLRRPGPYVALIIAALFTIPVLVWNQQHHWVTLQHLKERGGLDTQWKFTTRYFFDFILAEFGLLHPVFAVAMVWAGIAFWRGKDNFKTLPASEAHNSLASPEGGEGRGEEANFKGSPSPQPSPRSFLAGRGGQSDPEPATSSVQPLLLYFFSMGAPVFIFYFLYTFRARVQPNWIAPSVVPLFALMTVYFEKRWRGRGVMKTALIAGIALGLVATMVMQAPGVIPLVTGKPLPPKINPLRRVSGWAEAADVVGAERQQLLTEGKPVFLIGDHYGTTSLLTFYLPAAKQGVPGQPLAYERPSTNAESQFYFWPGYETRKGENALYVAQESEAKAPPEFLTDQFASVTDLGLHEVRHNGQVYRHLQIFACRGLR